MRALSIRQPYVEEILRGKKKVEYRNRPTKIIGQPFYIRHLLSGAGRFGIGTDSSPSGI